MLSDDNGENLMKTAASCTGVLPQGAALPQGADLGALSGFMSQLKQSISLLVAEIGELKRFAMEKECEKDAAIAELREEVRILKQEGTRPYDRTPCEYSSASERAHQAQSHAQQGDATGPAAGSSTPDSYAVRVRAKSPTPLTASAHTTSTNTKYEWNMVRAAAGRQRQTPVHLKGGKKIARKVVFVGGISINCCAEDLLAYCRQKQVEVTGCRMYSSKKVYGTMWARLTVVDKDESKVLEPDFWPQDVSARRWEFRDPPLTVKS